MKYMMLVSMMFIVGCASSVQIPSPKQFVAPDTTMSFVDGETLPVSTLRAYYRDWWYAINSYKDREASLAIITIGVDSVKLQNFAPVAFYCNVTLRLVRLFSSEICGSTEQHNKQMMIIPDTLEQQSMHMYIAPDSTLIIGGNEIGHNTYIGGKISGRLELVAKNGWIDTDDYMHIKCDATYLLLNKKPLTVGNLDIDFGANVFKVLDIFYKNLGGPLSSLALQSFLTNIDANMEFIRGEI